MRRMAALLLVALVCGCRAKSEAPTTVIIVRHAEKLADAGTDPDLSAAGVARANALAAVAGRAGVEVAYVTQFKRSKETAAPLRVPMIEIPVNLAAPGDYPGQLASAITSRSAGKVVLVVGHSNTVPAVVEMLAHVAVPPIGDAEYDRLYVVTLPAEGPPRLLAAQYGH